MKISAFDELNTPKVQVEEPEEYFKKMDISPEQREERVETSKELADVMLFLFALLAIEMQANKPNYPSVLKSFRQRFWDVVSRHSRIDEYVENYINEFTGGVFDNTKRYMEAAGVVMNGRTDAGWWTSVDRATAIGENQANSILNYEELQQALDEGYTTKEWITERDNRVRPTHKEVDGVTIGISEYFIVGGGMMLAPHDEYNNPEECPNCRCSLKFGNKVNKDDKESQYTEEQKREKERIENEPFKVRTAVGAMARRFYVKDPKAIKNTNLYIKPNTYVEDVLVIAAGDKIREVNRLIKEYPISKDMLTKVNDWYKVRGRAIVTDGKKEQSREIHWYQAKNVGKVEFKFPSNPKQV